MNRRIHIRLDLIVDIPNDTPDDHDSLEEACQEAFVDFVGDVGVENLAGSITVVGGVQ